MYCERTRLYMVCELNKDLYFFFVINYNTRNIYDTFRVKREKNT